MNEIEKAIAFLEAATGWMVRAREQAAYQDGQIDVWRTEAKRWQKRAQDAEVELNNIRAWATTPTKAEQNANNSMVGKSVNDVPGYSAEVKSSFIGQGPMGLDR